MITDFRVGLRYTTRAAGLGLGLFLLAGCEEMPEGLSFLQPGDQDVNEVSSAAAPAATKLIERDVEAPDVFSATESGLWDGRPSLGGVWVAHPDVAEPERVIIRNTTNGQFVIGALFRREREIPGPRLQTSSDAAAALGMLAGAPVQLNVTALRREQVEIAPPVKETTELAAAEAVATEELEASPEITEQALDPIATAGAALDEGAVSEAVLASTTGVNPYEPEAAQTAEAAPEDVVEPTPAAAPSPKPEPTRVPSSLSKPFLQIGIFSVEANANRTADMMRNAGMIPTVYSQSSNGKPFWRVVVGPAQSSAERASLLKKVKEAGFSDAYAVSN